MRKLKMIARRQFVLSLMALATSQTFAANKKTPSLLRPPLAREEVVKDVYWGKEVLDPYRWMEQKPDTAEFMDYLKQQGAFARQALDKLPGRKSLESSLSHFSAATTELAVRQVTSKYIVYAKRAPGQQTFWIYARPHGGGDERLLINPEVNVKDGAPRRITGVLMSPDSRYLAYGIDKSGDEIRELRVLTLETGADTLVTQLNGIPSSWLPDSSGFFYTRLREDAVKGKQDFNFGTSAWLHKMGNEAGKDSLALRWSDGPAMGQSEREMPMVHTSDTSDWALAAMYSNGEWPAYGMVTPVSTLAQGSGQVNWTQVFAKEDIAVTALIHADDVYVLAKGKSERGEVFKVNIKTPGQRSVVVPQGEYVIDSLSLAKDGLYIHELRGQLGALRRYSFATGKVEDVALPLSGAVWEIKSCVSLDGAWFGMDDLTMPAVTMYAGIDLKAVNTGLTPKAPFDTSKFVTTRVNVQARDGTAVPIEILHKTTTRRDGKNPVLIDAYGSYGIVLDPGFQGSKLAFLDQGGVIVYAHVRGGGEKGETWHVAGQKANKPNTWRDAIDVAEALIRDGWTARGKIALWGTSAGGIMVGRAITERPDLFAAAIGEVGIFNTMRFELTSNGPGNDEEFGTVKKEDECRALFEMDTFHHVRPDQTYPATLLITGANDLRVEPWQIAKLAARMQKNYDPKHPVWLRVDYETGHFATTRKNAVEKNVDIFSFVLKHTHG
ncbi:prolyl oligopeptidase family serine peptidase [Undibacterium sp. TJN19]|uniref:prolyl oligopeptidase family serine peptidase n=1 Tax=Undibacterium sp. TJN19 TaxID=3413055 RepID=UPI003BF3A121